MGRDQRLVNKEISITISDVFLKIYTSMKYIFTKKQFESLGVSSYLDPIVDSVKKNLSDTNREYSLSVKMHGKSVKINFVYDIESELYKGQKLESYAQLINPDPDNIEYLVNLGSLSDSSIIHEIKHVDRDVARGLTTDFHYYLNHVGRDVIENYSGGFRTEKDSDYLSLIFYLVNPDEFESHYNDLYKDLTENIPATLSPLEKRDKIKEFLEDTDFYVVYKDLSAGNFSLEYLFNDRESLNYFLTLFSIKMDQFIEDDPEYNDWGINIEVVDMKKMEIYINKLLYRTALKGFKKINRIYSLF
jgi:hypothetical protein